MHQRYVPLSEMVRIPYCQSFQSTIGRTPLFYAFRGGQTEALEALQESVKAQDLRKGALHWAAEAGEPEVLRALLEDPGVRIGIDDWDSNRNTPLYLAAYAHRPAALKFLLDDGADVHATSEDRRPCREESLSSKPRRQRSGTKCSYAPIHSWARLSTAYSDLNLEEILTKHEKLFDYWWMQDVMSMLETIEGAQHCLCMILLISAGVDIDAKRRTDGRTALMILSPWMENKMGVTALDTAAMWNRGEILAMFSREDELARSPSTSESGT